MKLFTYAASTFLLGSALAADLTLTDLSGLHLASYDQRGNAVRCRNDATVDGGVGQTGGTMDFASDSLEMCARVCDCRQGCASFTWVKPANFDGSPSFVLVPGTSGVGDQGKCSLHTSDCTASNQEQADAETYSFAKKDATPTDVQTTYPRSDGADSETEVTDQIACLLDGVAPVDGYVAMGGGGAFPGVCASGGKNAKLEALDMASGGTVQKCRESCDGSDECRMFNIDTTTGVCKFRNQRCKTQWVSGTAQPYTTYIKGSVTVDVPTPPTTRSPSPPSPPSPPTDSATDSASTGAAAISLVAVALALGLALVN